MPGYDFFRRDRNRHGGGVGFYIKSIISGKKSNLTFRMLQHMKEDENVRHTKRQVKVLFLFRNAFIFPSVYPYSVHLFLFMLSLIQ